MVVTHGIGGQGRNRTIDTRIFSPLLYQLSYLAAVRNGGEPPEGGVFNRQRAGGSSRRRKMAAVGERRTYALSAAIAARYASRPTRRFQ